MLHGSWRADAPASLRDVARCRGCSGDVAESWRRRRSWAAQCRGDPSRPPLRRSAGDPASRRRPECGNPRREAAPPAGRDLRLAGVGAELGGRRARSQGDPSAMATSGGDGPAGAFGSARRGLHRHRLGQIARLSTARADCPVGRSAIVRTLYFADQGPRGRSVVGRRLVRATWNSAGTVRRGHSCRGT